MSMTKEQFSLLIPQCGHLAFCDVCLQRYIDLMYMAPLMTPEHSCRENLRVRLRERAHFVSSPADMPPQQRQWH